MTISVNDPVQTVNNYLDALEKADFERLRTYLSDTFTYRGPTVQFDNPDDFMSLIWRLSQILNHIEKRKFFVDGVDVCGIMNLHIHIDIPKSVPVVQWFVVKENKIVSIEVFFDATDYSALFVTE